MKNDAFVSQLPDVVEKSRVIEESRSVRKELEDSTLPIYKNAVKVFSPNDLKSNEAKNLQQTYEKLTNRKSSIIDDVAQALPLINKNLSDLEDLASKTLNDQIVKSSISIKEINILQLVGIASFVSSYSRKILSFFYTAESAQFDNSSIKLDESFSKADIQWITTNFLDYINALGSLSANGIDVVISKIPDIHVSPDNIRSISTVQSSNKIDPLKLQYLNVTNNFVFRLMLRFTELQADNYKLALEEKRMLEYRHLLLKRQRDGKVDARLEKEIVITEDRISRLTYKIRKMEESND